LESSDPRLRYASVAHLPSGLPKELTAFQQNEKLTQQSRNRGLSTSHLAFPQTSYGKSIGDLRPMQQQVFLTLLKRVNNMEAL